MSKIKVGSQVKINKQSKYYGKSHYNPVDLSGVVVQIKTEGLPIKVEWSNSYRNVYNNEDLELVEDTKEVKRHKPKAWVKEAFKLSQQGKNSIEIAKALGVADRTVRHNLQVHATYGTETIAELGAVVKPKPVQPRKPTIFVIGDLQVKQGIELDYIHHIGAYIAKKQPTIIVQIGDWFDNASLSSYDRGQLSAEGKRLSADIATGNEAIRIIDSYIRAVPNYHPRKVVTLGNHEDRIQRFVNENPALSGFLGSHLYHFERYGWEVYDFLTPCIIEDIAFVHYVVAVNTGKPLGNALAGRLEKVGTSFVMGHQQTFAYHERSLQLTGAMQMALVIGACYDHDEPYKGVQGNHHFRGCVMLYEVQDGYAMHKKITLRHMKDVYETTVH